MGATGLRGRTESGLSTAGHHFFGRRVQRRDLRHHARGGGGLSRATPGLAQPQPPEPGADPPRQHLARAGRCRSAGGRGGRRHLAAEPDHHAGARLSGRRGRRAFLPFGGTDHRPSRAHHLSAAAPPPDRRPPRSRAMAGAHGDPDRRHPRLDASLVRALRPHHRARRLRRPGAGLSRHAARRPAVHRHAAGAVSRGRRHVIAGASRSGAGLAATAAPGARRAAPAPAGLPHAGPQVTGVDPGARGRRAAADAGP